MAEVSNEALRKFSEQFNACTKRIGGGKIGLDSSALRKLVRENREVSARFVELYCVMGQSNPAFFQGAMVVATAYHVEFGDESLVEAVADQVKAAGAEQWLRGIGVSKEMPAAEIERPERKAAKEWWRSNTKESAQCDNCDRPLMRGQGFLISGRVFTVGLQRMEMGEELVCEECFKNIR